MTDREIEKAREARDAAKKAAEIESAWRQRERETSGYYAQRRLRRAAARREPTRGGAG